MLEITKENINVILNNLYGEKISTENQNDIKAVLFSNTMTPKGTLKTIGAILKAKYVCIEDKRLIKTGNNHTVYALDRGNPYIKTIFCFRNIYFWGSYGETIENYIYSFEDNSWFS